MLAPLSWLKDYVDIDVTPKELEEKLFSCGFEVEELQATLDLEITFLPSPGVNGLRGQQCHTIIAIVRREIYILRGCLGHHP